MSVLERQIVRARTGDRRAFESLMRRFQDRAFAVALAQLRDFHQAEDAVQEAFVEAFLRLDQLQTPEAFPHWLHKIVLGKCVRALRTGKSVRWTITMESLRESAMLSPDPAAVVVEQAVRETLQQAMLVLSEEEREAFLLFAIGGYRYAEISEKMNLSLPLVKKRIYTARQRLRNGEELASLRPSLRPGLEKRVTERVKARTRIEKEKQMEMKVELVGPGIESKTAVKNLYAFSRYEELMLLHYDTFTPPPNVTEETWQCGSWVNQYGVINGMDSQTHDEAVAGFDNFWTWSNLQGYLITVNGWPVGFALVASPPNATPGVDYRLQDFFILNKARRKGIGANAVRQLFDRLPGRWELAYNPANEPATTFWRKFIPAYTGGDYTDEMIGMGYNNPDLPGFVFTRGPRPTHPIKIR